MMKSETRPTAPLRAEHATMMARVQALAERIETLHEQKTLDQLSTAREVVEFIRRQVAPRPRRGIHATPPPTGPPGKDPS